MFIPANPYQNIEYVSYIFLAMSFLIFYITWLKKQELSLGACCCFCFSIIAALGFYMQDFYYVFHTQNITVEFSMFFKYGSGMIMSCLGMIIVLLVVYVLRKRELVIGKKYLVLASCVVIMLAWSYYLQMRMLDDIDIKLLLSMITSLQNYQIFAFTIFLVFVFTEKR